MKRVKIELLIIITCLLLGYVISHKFLEVYRNETSVSK
jgi:uncharacterized membrane protein YwzB